MSAEQEPEVLVSVEARAGRLTLNRPAALHALTLGMCQAMTDALLAWRRDPNVALIVIDHSGERGFCAGGDIRMLAESGAGDGAAARTFFFTEYRLNHLLFNYETPVVAIMDGVTMGGGVGISAPARYRIATERSTFAMPESGIGLFPDVGGGWFLPRLPGKSGLWLALTGARLKAADCLALGVATHFVESARMADLKAALAEASRAADIDAAVTAVLAQFAGDPGSAPITPQHADIDRLFSGETMEAIVAGLAADGGDWAMAQLKVLGAKSPQAMKVALRQLATGAGLSDFADNMAMEFRIGARVVQRKDFLEGVRAVIIDKDQSPRWSPATLEAVTPTVLDEIFAPLPVQDEWSPVPEYAQ